MSRLKGADLGVQLPTGTMNYRGAWSASPSPAYALNDVVLRNGVPYTNAIAGTTSDPATPITTALGTIPVPSGYLGTNDGVGQEITVAQACVVNALRVYLTQSQAVGTGIVRVGIATGVTATTAYAAINWLGYVDVDITTLATGAQGTGGAGTTVPLPVGVSLIPGTTYTLCMVKQSGSPVPGAISNNLTKPSPTGLIATLGNVFVGTSTGAFTSSNTSAAHFDIYGAPWQPLSPAATPLNYRGAWSAAPTYSVDDVVMRNGAYLAVAAGAGHDPALDVPVAVASSQPASFTMFGNNAYTGFGWIFTVTAAETFNEMDLWWGSDVAIGTGTFRIGVATGLTTTTPYSAINWVKCADGVTPAYVDVDASAIQHALTVAAGGSKNAFVMPGDVPLVTGTTYYLCVVSLAGTGNPGSVVVCNTAPTLTNMTAAGSGSILGQSGASFTGAANSQPRVNFNHNFWQLLAPVLENVNIVAASGATQTLPDVTTATMHNITLTANTTVTLPAPGAGKSFTVRLTQDATGGRTVAWATPSGAIRWPGGTAPVITATANAVDVVSFACIDGTNWLGFIAGQAFA